MIRVKYDEITIEKLNELINDQESFEVIGLGNKMSEAVEMVEKTIEANGYRCRVYTYGRVASAGATLLGGVTGIAGVAAVAGMAAHNLATLNPDFEISKHIVDRMLTVKYCKS